MSCCGRKWGTIETCVCIAKKPVEIHMVRKYRGFGSSKRLNNYFQKIQFYFEI